MTIIESVMTIQIKDDFTLSPAKRSTRAIIDLAPGNLSIPNQLAPLFYYSIFALFTSACILKL